ncbi:hypothetical protein ABZP36_001446 [Zizania latifolia]
MPRRASPSPSASSPSGLGCPPQVSSGNISGHKCSAPPNTDVLSLGIEDDRAAAIGFIDESKAEMKQFAKSDTSVLKQHYEKKLHEMEQEKKALQKEIEDLRHALTNISYYIDESSQQLKENYLQKLNTLESQASELKKKEEAQQQLLWQKQKSDDAAKRLQEEIHHIKSQKVFYPHIIKHLNKEQEADQSNFCDSSTNAELEVQEKTSLEWFANECKKFGCTLEFVINKSEEDLATVVLTLELLGLDLLSAHGGPCLRSLLFQQPSQQ